MIDTKTRDLRIALIIDEHLGPAHVYCQSCGAVDEPCEPGCVDAAIAEKLRRELEDE